MARCLISFGANLGNPLETIQSAAANLCRELEIDEAGGSHSHGSFSLSRFYRTPPVGGPSGQPPFVNAVAAIETSCGVQQVWQAIRDVEQQLGRQRNRRWEARQIDLDILLFDDQRIWLPQLKIPHPRMCMRRFILVPAMEVAAAWVDPVSQRSIQALAENLQHGAGSVLLIADEADSANRLLHQVAELALATQVPWQSLAGGAIQKNRHESRVVALATPQQLASHPQATRALKLSMVLADPLSSDSRWEQQQAELAQSLGLTEVPPGGELGGDAITNVKWTDGPRYLLASKDPNWIVHEMVAALEAMDCPVEPLVL